MFLKYENIGKKPKGALIKAKRVRYSSGNITHQVYYEQRLVPKIDT